MIIILSYLNHEISKLSFIQHPIAVIRALISALAIILCRTACSVLRILPLSGRIAWNFESLPDLAEPHAESPSTIYNSVPCFHLLEQSASLPGRTHPDKALFLSTVSFANLAANLALAAKSILEKILSNSSG
jgi:hypothetical protein